MLNSENFHVRSFCARSKQVSRTFHARSKLDGASFALTAISAIFKELLFSLSGLNRKCYYVFSLWIQTVAAVCGFMSCDFISKRNSFCLYMIPESNVIAERKFHSSLSLTPVGLKKAWYPIWCTLIMTKEVDKNSFVKVHQYGGGYDLNSTRQV